MPSKKPKPSTSRPQATSAISQPTVEDTSLLSNLSAFSPRGNLFAFLSLAVEKHRLRVYDTATGQSVAEHILDSARVSSLSWSTYDSSDAQAAGPPSKKKRRKSQTNADGPLQAAAVEVVVLGLSDGTVLFFSPTHGRCPGNVDLCWKNDDPIPFSSMALRPASDDDRVDILVAHHSIRLLSASSDSLTDKPAQVASFTGHASSVKQLHWDASQLPSTRFASLAEGDRVVSIWDTPENSATEGRMVASVQLDSDARFISFSLASPTTSERQNLLVLAASGKISIYPIPTELSPPTSSGRPQQLKVSTLLPRSTLSVSTKKASAGSHPVAASFAAGVNGNVRVARIVGGVRPVFDLVPYLDEKGDFIPEVTLDDVKISLLSESQDSLIPNQRYTEARSSVRSGVEMGLDETMDDLAPNAIDGELDVDLAELSLGQRLTALSGDPRPASSSDSDEDDPAPNGRKQKSVNHKQPSQDGAVPANSLTRTLIQALHSSDTRLLETCLTHSDQTVIRNTIRRLPPQLAVPLISACVERLGRGARAANMKGGGGGASSQRGGTLIIWVKTVLAVHSGHLMTMPDLVARLAGLHATLSSRLALQENLLSLSGRLDMVLAQIEMRSSVAPAPLAPKKGTQSTERAATGKKNVTRYVEGESADEDEDEQMEVEVEVDSGEDAGSVEDVELGGEESESSSEGEEGSDEQDSGEDEESDDNPTNAFIDDEASEEEDDEDSE
uniref:Small-subunit processome Utp12 domain-containing protein n=1 Tax=Mycena chlorophos TaxID=658473 RepID=A0ABQ0M2H5_MYCCL|nr:predicted protein [Mycena chlorophos]